MEGRRLQAVLAGGFAGLLVAAGLGGCVETGDFGRPKRSAWNDAVVATGASAALLRGEPVSPFPLTDDETEMRGRAWRFLVPAHDRVTLDRLLAELAATRIAPATAVAEARAGDPAAYLDALASEGASSPSSRYRRVGEDIAADGRLLAPFARVARRVLAADAVRLASLDHAREIRAGEVPAAFARVVENRCLVAWVARASAGRLDAYRFALEHLVIAAPQTDAVPVERALPHLAAEREGVEALGAGSMERACDGAVEPGPVVLSRRG